MKFLSVIAILMAVTSAEELFLVDNTDADALTDLKTEEKSETAEESKATGEE